MKITKTDIEGLLVIEPFVYNDDRGYFFESYNLKAYKDLGIDVDFVQDNQSCSKKNVLRGLHFQKPPFAQAKLVSVIKGSVMDVVVDIRKESPTYGKYFSIVLSSSNKKLLYIPEGFAHGFLTLEDDTIFSYFVSKIGYIFPLFSIFNCIKSLCTLPKLNGEEIVVSLGQDHEMTCKTILSALYHECYT